MAASLTHNVELTIATEDLLKNNPELYHYTTYAGLEGIIKSNTLWATHFNDLNDTTEIWLLKNELQKALTNRFKEIVKVRQRDSLKIRMAVEKEGGVTTTAMSLAADFVNGLYKTTFEESGAFPFTEAYITSFCSHPVEQEYEIKNGLLSQWRGYGRDGGYCLVFDTKTLAADIAHEFDSYFYVHMQLEHVRYAFDKVKIEDVFPVLLDRCDLFLNQIFNQKLNAPEDGMQSFVSAATLYKHQGFKEEREVRVVAISGTQRIADRVKVEHKDFDVNLIKTTYVRKTLTGNKRYITLFDTLRTPLPIKRIIIGPSRHQEDNYNQAVALLEKDFPITKSGTPFIE